MGCEHSTLRVEGQDDKHTLIHLLKRHGIEKDSMPDKYPAIEVDKGIEGVLGGIEGNVRVHSDRAVGFVLDADSPIHDRWRAVTHRLKKARVTMPSTLPPEGFIGESKEYKAKVGIWLMPDNQHDGKLETFLQTLIDEGDPLIDHAKKATNQAKKIGAEFSGPDHDKAVIHSWLAWQKEPGRPYGTAIRAKFFRHNSAPADAFVEWFRELFEIPIS